MAPKPEHTAGATEEAEQDKEQAISSSSSSAHAVEEAGATESQVSSAAELAITGGFSLPATKQSHAAHSPTVHVPRQHASASSLTKSLDSH